MKSTVGLLVHIAGVVALSQLILTGNKYRQDFYDKLNNGTVLRETFNKFFDNLSVAMPLIGVGTLLQSLLYLIATLYVLHLAR